MLVSSLTKKAVIWMVVCLSKQLSVSSKAVIYLVVCVGKQLKNVTKLSSGWCLCWYAAEVTKLTAGYLCVLVSSEVTKLSAGYLCVLVSSIRNKAVIWMVVCAGKQLREQISNLNVCLSCKRCHLDSCLPW